MKNAKLALGATTTGDGERQNKKTIKPNPFPPLHTNRGGDSLYPTEPEK